MARPRSRRNLAALLVSLAPLVAVVLAQAVAAASGPSVETARVLASAGQLELAKREARAVAELGRDSDAARALYDSLQVESLAAIRDPAALWPQLAAAFFFSPEKRAQASQQAVAFTAEAASSLRTAGNYGQSLVLVAGVPPP